MKKFTVKSIKGVVTIYEVDVEVLPSICEPGLKPGEWMARVLKPESFHMKIEKNVEGKKETVLTPDVWCWHAFQETKDEALDYAYRLIKQEFAFNERKYGTAYTDEDVATAVAGLKFVPLSV